MGGISIIRRKGLFGITWGGTGAETWDYAKAWNLGATGETGVVDRVYAQNSVISTAIAIFAGDAATLEFDLYADGADDDPLESHPVLDLMARPSPVMSGHQLKVGSYLSMKLFGESFWYYPQAMLGTRNGLKATAKNSGSIVLLDPRSVRADTTSGNVKWLWSVNGRDIALDASRLTQFKRINPYDPLRGLSEIDALLIEIESDYSAASFNRAFFRDQRGVPSGLLIPSTAMLSPVTEREDFAKRMNAEASSGRRKHVGIIPPGWAWQDIGVSHKDMEFRSLREYAREMMLGAIGVPPFMAGVLDKANYANAREQREAYWMGPQTRFITSFVDTLNNDFLPKLGVEGVTLFPRWEAIKSLTENLSEKADIAGKLFALGFTKRQLNDRLELGLEVDELEDADIGYLPFNVTPVSMVLNPPEPEPIVPPAAPDESLDDAEPVKSKGVPRGEQQRAFAWRAIAGRTRDLESRFAKMIRGHFSSIEREVLGNIKGLAGWMLQQKAADDGNLFDKAAAKRRLQAAASAQYRAAMARGIDAVAAEIGRSSSSLSMVDPTVIARLMELTSKITGIDDTIEAQLRSAVSDGLQAGETIPQLADRIRGVMDASQARATTIARTETGAAFSGGRHLQMKDAGITQHEWLSARDGSVRESHQIDGQVIGIGETFTNGLRYPNDPGGPPEEVINCRCVAIPVVSEA